MLKAIILEDEDDSAKLLSGFLKDYCRQVEVVAIVDTVQSCLASIYEHQPDVVFMDIELKGETSFDLLNKLGTVRFEIVFTTAYAVHAIKAFRLSAIDYLLKPINVEELQSAVKKVEEKRNQAAMSKSIPELLNNLKNNLQDQKIGLSTSDGLIFLKISNIVYLKSDGAYTHFILKNKEKLLTSKNIKEYEDLLAEHGFYRIHKSHIINKHEIIRYVRGDGGYVIMSNGDNLDVSRRKKDEFLSELETD